MPDTIERFLEVDEIMKEFLLFYNRSSIDVQLAVYGAGWIRTRWWAFKDISAESTLSTYVFESDTP